MQVILKITWQGCGRWNWRWPLSFFLGPKCNLMSFSHFSPYDSSHHRKFCLWCKSQRAQRGKRNAECWLHRQTGGLIHLSPLGENRGNEEQNSSPGEKFKVEKSTGSQRKGEKCFSPHSFFSHCRTQGQPHFSQLCSRDTAELHLQRLLRFSVSRYSWCLNPGFPCPCSWCQLSSWGR